LCGTETGPLLNAARSLFCYRSEATPAWTGQAHPASSHDARAWCCPDSAACQPRQLQLRHAPPAFRPPCAVHGAAAPGAAPLAGPRLLSATASLTFLLLFTATATECSPTPLCLSLSTSTPSIERWPLCPAFVRPHATVLRKDCCSTEPAASFIAEAAFPSTAASGAPPAPLTPPIASPELRGARRPHQPSQRQPADPPHRRTPPPTAITAASPPW
jgi:hypothetical protein